MSQYNEIILPESVYQNVRSFQQYKKSNVRIEPQGVSSNIGQNQVVEFVLPQGQLVDISSFAIHLDGFSTSTATAVLPSFGWSFIQRLEVQASGSTLQTINNYNVLMNTLSNCAESLDHATSLLSVYGGAENTYVPDAAKVNTKNIVSNFIGFLGCKKLIPITNEYGLNDVRVRITMAPANILADSVGGNPTYTISKMYATVSVVQMSEPSLETAIKSLNGTPEISFDYFQNYSEVPGAGAQINMKVPVVASSLKNIILTARKTSYNTVAAMTAAQGRALNQTNYFKFEGGQLSDVYIDTGAGNFPSSALSKAEDMAYFTAQSIGLDDNWATGAWGWNGIAAATALSVASYKNWGYALIFGFNHTDAPAGLLLGLNSRGMGQFLIRANQSGADTFQYDAFTCSSAVLTLKPGQFALQI